PHGQPQPRASAPGPPPAGLAALLARVQERLEALGELPAFSASLNRVRRVSADPEADAMAVAREVMKDAALSARLLRLANSPHYNRGQGRVGLVSRAVILLGFETVRNLTLTVKLLEGFQAEHPGVDLARIQVRAYLGAALLRELALAAGLREAEESYVCALLHPLGELALAAALPEEHLRLQQRLAEGAERIQAEEALLGAPLHELGRALAASWGFPPAVTATLAPPPEVDGPLPRDAASFNRALVPLGHRLVRRLQGEEGAPGEAGEPLEALLARVSRLAGVDHDRLDRALEGAYRRACALAEGFGLDPAALRPRVTQTGDALRDRWARRLAFLADAPEETAPSAQPDGRPEGGGAGGAPAAGACAPRRERLLLVLRQLAELLAARRGVNQVFAKVLEGLVEGAGFHRAALCLLTPDRRAYALRLAAGRELEPLREAFRHRPLDPETDPLAGALCRGQTLVLEDPAGAPRPLPRELLAAVAPGPLMAAPLALEGRPLGFVYADLSLGPEPLRAHHHEDLRLLVSQARIALHLAG
ncbi:MAG: GAF domain-containing protein, partial [Gammaproteobacteria bacterium]